MRDVEKPSAPACIWQAPPQPGNQALPQPENIVGFDILEFAVSGNSLLEAADIVKASDEDLAALELDPDIRAAAAMAHARMGSGVFVLTEGSSGALLFDADGHSEVTGYSVDHVEDTVGAGDTFHAAFLAQVLRAGVCEKGLGSLPRESLADALDFACAAAAINVSRAGCSPPTQAEVEKFVRAAGK